MEALNTGIILLERVYSSAMEAFAFEISTPLLLSMAYLVLAVPYDTLTPSISNENQMFCRDPTLIERVSIPELCKEKKPEFEVEDGSEDDSDNDDEDEVEGGEEHDNEDAGEEEEDEGDPEDQPEANGDAGSGGDEEDDDDDDDDEDEDDDEEEEEIPQPPAKKRK